MSEQARLLEKRPTGIAGLDALTEGGLPVGQATLLCGGPGAGKTVLCLQTIANAIESGAGGGVFVTFEETPAQIRRDAKSFAWGDALMDSEKFRLIDAREQASVPVSGDFDLSPMLAYLGQLAEECKAAWVVIDGIDQLIRLIDNPRQASIQLRKINEWCEGVDFGLIMSAKASDDMGGVRDLDGVEYMLPTVINLRTEMRSKTFARFCRIAKYRGTSHSSQLAHVLIDDSGIRLPFQESRTIERTFEANREKISVGVEALDEYMGGGLYKGSVTLISGRPGTAKSTLASAFVKAATDLGERALFISFDEDHYSLVRNLKSVGIDLDLPKEKGLIEFLGLSSWANTAMVHFVSMMESLRRYQPSVLVIDSLSALRYNDDHIDPRDVIEHILDHASRNGITSIVTSLSAGGMFNDEASLSHVSTVADNWLVLDYNVRAGERNRSISIVKSRGVKHSNQQRELILGEDGIRLADVYEYGTEVLMGTARAAHQLEAKRIAGRQENEHRKTVEELKRRMEQTSHELERLQMEIDAEQTRFSEEQASSLRELETIRKVRRNLHDQES
ncbi:MAG: ATPase domain-containing protein [Gammaproteobacteria bacterium]|nr:ATPase domain-containing protein [Gammaproteobacteria bacterium]